MYIEVLIGLKGSKSIVSFFSLLSSVSTSPQKRIKPFGGVRLYNFKRCWVDVMADKTDNLLTRDLMHEAVPYSSVNILLVRFMSCFALRIKVMAEVPLPLAESNILIKRLTLNCSMALSPTDVIVGREGSEQNQNGMQLHFQ
jgi:hypothetical protein